MKKFKIREKRTPIIKKFKISRAFILVVVPTLLSIAKILTFDQIASVSTGGVSTSDDFLIRIDKIATESSSSKNDSVQDASVLAVDVDFLTEQNQDKVRDDEENDLIPKSTKIVEFNDNA